MATTRTTTTREGGQLAHDVAAANELRSMWKRGGTRRTSRAKTTASASNADDEAPCTCDDCVAQPPQPGDPSALINSAWLDDLAATLRTRARELDEHVAAWKESGESEWFEVYRRLAHALRVDAVTVQRQSECEWAVMREAVNRVHAARPAFALIG